MTNVNKSDIERYLKNGYRYAYHYSPVGTLSGALCFKMVATSKKSAKQAAESIFYLKERTVKIWNLAEELSKLAK